MHRTSGNSRGPFVRGATSVGTSLAVVLFCAAFCACGTSIRMTPNVASTCVAGFRVAGKVDYDGNKDYLPRVIADSPSSRSPVIYRYAHAAQYGSQNVPDALALFNPLTLVGFPTGGNTVRIAGKLDVVVDNAVIKTYSAGAVLDKTRSMFAGETFTELRRLGLIAVRDNLEAQLCGDGRFLAGLSTRASRDNDSGGASKETRARIGEENGAVAEGTLPVEAIPDGARSAKTHEPGITAPAADGKTAENANGPASLAASPGVAGNPEEIADYLRMGKTLYDEGDYARAIGVYKRILNVYAGNKEASEGLLRAEKARAAADDAPGK